jgi:hypothetical protein
MITPLLDFWVQTFTTQLMTHTEDDLRMTVVKKAPFQDDPTRKAPYLLMSIDEDLGLVPDSPSEIGGPLRWQLHLKLRAAPKVVSTVDRAYHLVDVLSMRVCHIIRAHTFDHPTALNGSCMDNRDWFTITKVMPKVYGGEREWLSHVDVFFFARIKEPGPAPYGTYPNNL